MFVDDGSITGVAFPPLKKKKDSRDWPSGIVVKFAHSTSAAWGSSVRIPGADPMHCLSSHAVMGVPHKIEKDGHGC